MDVKKYFNKLNRGSQQILSNTLSEYSEQLGKAHHSAACIYEFSELVTDKDERQLLSIVSAQIEVASLSLTFGLYRQSFSSLRLALEIALATISFSVDKLKHNEWLKGQGDIKWATLIDKENGVLSPRFSNAFFAKLTPFIAEYNLRAGQVYRSLSEFVHGNNETWSQSGIKLKQNRELTCSYFEKLNEIFEIVLFALICRYSNVISGTNLENLNEISSQLNHIEPIRVFLGGPKNK